MASRRRSREGSHEYGLTQQLQKKVALCDSARQTLKHCCFAVDDEANQGQVVRFHCSPTLKNDSANTHLSKRSSRGCAGRVLGAHGTSLVESACLQRSSLA